MAKHAVLERQLLPGEYDATKLRSVKFDSDTDNGLVFKIGNLMEGEREVRSISAATAGTDLVTKHQLALVSTPEEVFRADEHLEDFYNKAGTVGRVDILEPMAFFGVTEEAFDGTPEAGKYVEVSASGKLKVADSDDKAFGKIVDFHHKFWGIEVLDDHAA